MSRRQRVYGKRSGRLLWESPGEPLDQYPDSEYMMDQWREELQGETVTVYDDDPPPSNAIRDISDPEHPTWPWGGWDE